MTTAAAAAASFSGLFNWMRQQMHLRCMNSKVYTACGMCTLTQIAANKGEHFLNSFFKDRFTQYHSS